MGNNHRSTQHSYQREELFSFGSGKKKKLHGDDDVDIHQQPVNDNFFVCAIVDGPLSFSSHHENRNLAHSELTTFYIFTCVEQIGSEKSVLRRGELSRERDREK